MFRLNRACFPLLLALLALLGGCDSGPPTAPTYSISGSITPAAAGVPVTLTGPVSVTVMTDAGGSFAFTDLEPGEYTVGPAEPGFVFEPNERVVTIAAADVTAQTFVRRAPDEGVSPAELARLDGIPDRRLPADSVILPNGQQLDDYLQSRGFLDDNGRLLPYGPDWSLQAQSAPTGPQQRKNDIVSRMLHAARDFACGRANPRCTRWDFPADPADPVNRPAQTGLTYVWGGKTLEQRIRGTDRCTAQTFGVDCSGLMSLVAAAGGLTAPHGSANQSDPASWNIPAAWQLKWKIVENSTIQAGDLLYWPGHIGIAESNGTGTSVNFISSTGAPNECARNIAPPRGPRSLPVSAWGSSPSKVLRLVTTLSGVFDLYLRCTAQQTDAAVIRFTINNDEGGPFRATGNGVDYDGTPLSFVLEGTYNQITNTLTATLSFADGTRADGIDVRLLNDDTGYFPLTKIIDNGGCAASGRMVRVQPGSMIAPLRAPDAPQQRAPSPRLGGTGTPPLNAKGTGGRRPGDDDDAGPPSAASGSRGGLITPTRAAAAAPSAARCAGIRDTRPRSAAPAPALRRG